MRIIILDDDPHVGRTIQLNWPDVDDTIEVFGTYADARAALFGRGPSSVDCVVLDLHLPDASGSTVLSEIRQAGRVPVLMLSGWGDADFRAELLNRGADDYLMKPLSVKELHARVQRLAARSLVQPDVQLAVVAIGQVTFDPATRRLHSLARTESLTEAEAALLSALIFGAGRPVARDDLYLKTFRRPYRDGEKALETYIGRLRQKLTSLGEDGNLRLLTARGIGYRLSTARTAT